MLYNFRAGEQRHTVSNVKLYPVSERYQFIPPEFSADDQELENQSAVFLRCDEFMDDTVGRGPIAPIIFLDENNSVIEEVVHAWPLENDAVNLFLEEEKVAFPNRKYYTVQVNEGWHVYAIDWNEIDLYVSNVINPFTHHFTVRPDIEEFDKNKHQGTISADDEGNPIVVIPYQVIISPRKIRDFA